MPADRPATVRIDMQSVAGYTCRRLIDLSLIAGTPRPRTARTHSGSSSFLAQNSSCTRESAAAPASAQPLSMTLSGSPLSMALSGSSVLHPLTFHFPGMNLRDCLCFCATNMNGVSKMMNFALKMINLALQNDEFCIKNDKFGVTK